MSPDVNGVCNATTQSVCRSGCVRLTTVVKGVTLLHEAVSLQNYTPASYSLPSTGGDDTHRSRACLCNEIDCFELQRIETPAVDASRASDCRTVKIDVDGGTVDSCVDLRRGSNGAKSRGSSARGAAYFRSTRPQVCCDVLMMAKDHDVRVEGRKCVGQAAGRTVGHARRCRARAVS